MHRVEEFVMEDYEVQDAIRNGLTPRVIEEIYATSMVRASIEKYQTKQQTFTALADRWDITRRSMTDGRNRTKEDDNGD